MIVYNTPKEAKQLFELTAEEITNMLAHNGVIVLKKVDISTNEFTSFASQLGTPRLHPASNAQLGGYREILVIGSNLDNSSPNFAPLDTTVGTWHTDYAYKLNTDCPSILKCVTVPPSGNYTGYINTSELFSWLDDSTKERFRNLEIIHDYNYFYKAYAKKRKPLSQSQKQKLQQTVKPLVITHPISQKETLFLSLETACGVVGKDDNESNAIIDELFSIVKEYPHKYYHKWEEGDLILWDNRCVAHRGFPHAQGEPREMHRITIESKYSFGYYL